MTWFFAPAALRSRLAVAGITAPAADPELRVAAASAAWAGEVPRGPKRASRGLNYLWESAERDDDERGGGWGVERGLGR